MPLEAHPPNCHQHRRAMGRGLDPTSGNGPGLRLWRLILVGRDDGSWVSQRGELSGFAVAGALVAPSRRLASVISSTHAWRERRPAISRCRPRGGTPAGVCQGAMTCACHRDDAAYSAGPAAPSRLLWHAVASPRSYDGPAPQPLCRSPRFLMSVRAVDVASGWVYRHNGERDK